MIAVWTGLLLAVHVLSIVTWVGGMFFALAVLRPSLGFLDPAPRVALHAQVFRRFFLVVWHVMPLTLLSGFGLVTLLYGGFATLPWPINAMMGLGLVMAVLFIVIVFGPWRTMRRAVSTAKSAEAADRIRRLVLANLIIGLLVIVLAALGRMGVA
jgi:uncharacterized membrane protein